MSLLKQMVEAKLQERLLLLLAAPWMCTGAMVTMLLAIAIESEEALWPPLLFLLALHVLAWGFSWIFFRFVLPHVGEAGSSQRLGWAISVGAYVAGLILGGCVMLLV